VVYILAPSLGRLPALKEETRFLWLFDLPRREPALVITHGRVVLYINNVNTVKLTNKNWVCIPWFKLSFEFPYIIFFLRKATAWQSYMYISATILVFKNVNQRVSVNKKGCIFFHLRKTFLFILPMWAFDRSKVRDHCILVKDERNTFHIWHQLDEEFTAGLFFVNFENADWSILGGQLPVQLPYFCIYSHCCILLISFFAISDTFSVVCFFYWKWVVHWKKD